MNKKQTIHKLNSEKGITAGDVVIALLIILTTLGVIMMVYTNLVISSRGVDRKTGATRIATNILENIGMNYYENIDSELKRLADTGKITLKNPTTYTVIGSQETVSVFNTTIPSGFSVDITLEKPENDLFDLLKKATVKVMYHLNGQTKSVELSKVLEKEVVRECNSPRFEEKYLQSLNIEPNQSIMSYENAENAAGNSIICPIKYNGESYQIVTDKNDLETMWYSYSNKQWARILVLEPDSDLNQTITPEMLRSEKAYVWVPRFGVENGGNLFGNTYFKYKNTNYAILNSYDEGNFVCNRLDLKNSIEWSLSYGISFDDETNELIGKWCPYSEIGNVNTDAYKLNHSQFGPLFQY